MSAMVFLVVSLAGSVVVGALRSAHLAPVRSESGPADAVGALRTGRALRETPRPALDPHTDPSRLLPGASAA